MFNGTPCSLKGKFKKRISLFANHLTHFFHDNVLKNMYIFISYIRRFADVRYFPKGFFPSGNFPRANFPSSNISKFAISQAANFQVCSSAALGPLHVQAIDLGPLAHPSLIAWPPLQSPVSQRA